LNNHFPQCALLNAMGIVYPLYWFWPNFDNSFTKHLAVLKVGTMSQNVWGLDAQVHWLHCCLIVGGCMCIKGCSSCVWKVILRLPWNRLLIWIHSPELEEQLMHLKFSCTLSLSILS
jgi:hypothetical protein